MPLENIWCSLKKLAFIEKKAAISIIFRRQPLLSLNATLWAIWGKHKFLNLPEKKAISKTCRGAENQIVLCRRLPWNASYNSHNSLYQILPAGNYPHFLWMWIPEGIARPWDPNKYLKHAPQTDSSAPYFNKIWIQAGSDWDILLANVNKYKYVFLFFDRK